MQIIFDTSNKLLKDIQIISFFLSEIRRKITTFWNKYIEVLIIGIVSHTLLKK
jgi:hypothetical protein